MSTGFLILMGTLLFYQVGEFMSYQKTSEMLIDVAEQDIFVSDTPLVLINFNVSVYTQH